MLKPATKGYLCVVAAAFMWASSGATGKFLFAGGMQPLELVQVRVTFSALTLALVFAVHQRHLFRIRRHDLGGLLLLGGVAMAANHLGYFAAISKIQVAAAILLQYLAPPLVALYSMCFWRERVTPLKVGSLLLALLGCYLVVGGYNLHLLQMNRIGICWGLLAGFSYAAYTLLGERHMHRYPPWTVLFYALLFATVTWHVLYPPFNYLWADHSLAEWGGLLYIVIVGTVIPFGLYFVGINYIRSTRAAITALLEPIAAGMMAYVFLGEVLEPLQLLGALLVIAAILLLQMQAERDELAPALVRSRATAASAGKGGPGKSDAVEEQRKND